MQGEKMEGNVAASALNRSMLVQECDLSQAVSSSGAVELGQDETGRNSMDSINNLMHNHGNQQVLSLVPRDDLKRKSSPNSNLPMSHNHVAGGSQQAVDKSYNLRGKLGSKSKVNMKQFLMSNKQQQ